MKTKSKQIQFIDLLPEYANIPSVGDISEKSSAAVNHGRETNDSNIEFTPSYNPDMPALHIEDYTTPRAEFGEFEPYSSDVSEPIDLLPDFYNQFQNINTDIEDAIQS